MLGNGAISSCFRIEELGLPRPAGLIMLSPWLDLTRSTSGRSPNQPTDWLTTFDSEECKRGAIDVYCGTEVATASDPRVSPLWRNPSTSALPKQYLSAGQSEVLYTDSVAWAQKVRETLGEGAIETDFPAGQVHTYAIGGWLADRHVEEESDRRILTYVRMQVCGK